MDNSPNGVRREGRGRAMPEAATGKSPRGRPPKPPGVAPKRVAHKHLTDADAKWMKTRDGIQTEWQLACLAWNLERLRGLSLS